MVTMKDIQNIQDNLKKCKPADLTKNSDSPLTNREAIKHLAPTLLKMRERGFATSALVELLRQHQITIKGRDLSRYLREFQGERPATPKPTRPKSSTAKPATLPSADKDQQK